MDTPAPNYHREFLKSPHHAALGLLTLGLGFLSATWLGLIAGATFYALGWIYLPDMPFFRRRVDRRLEAAGREEELRKVVEFNRRREALRQSLADSRRGRYGRLVEVCRDIERASADNPMAAPDPATDPRLRKLDELMWTYLRLLGIEETLDRFLETERRDDLAGTLKEAEAEAQRLNAEIETLKKPGNSAGLETRQRFLSSRLERLEVLRKRQQRTQQAQENRALVIAEEERLDEQIKLLRADAIAARNTEALTARIDATVEHLDQTNKWISELDEFKDLVGDLPPTDLRVGYEPAPPPPIIEGPSTRPRQKTHEQ
jgi:hypothetical protein